jgi:hypothetical protein
MYSNSYETSYYKDVSRVRSIASITTDYLILESFIPPEKRQLVGGWKSPDGVAFSYDNIPSLHYAFSTAYHWLTDDREEIYIADSDGVVSRLVSSRPLPEVWCNSTHFTQKMHSMLTMAPTIKPNANNLNEKAIMLAMGERRIQVSALTIQEVSSILYFLNHFDLCTASMAFTNQVLLSLKFLHRAGAG